MARCRCILFLLAAWVISQCAMEAEATGGRYGFLKEGEQGGVPEWARPGRMRYARCDGGPVEVCKAFMSGWESIRHPDAILACTNYYNDGTIAMLREARINWIWVTWSVGFSEESEAVQRRIVGAFIGKCREAGIRVTAYVSLTNMFIDDMIEHVPGAKDWIQVEADGTPRPYGAAKYDGKPTRILACLNRPGWLEYSKKRIAGAVEAGVDAIFYDNCFHGCKCGVCRRKFAEFTRSLYGESLPVPGARTDDASKNTQGQESTTRPESAGLAGRAWTRFCGETAAGALGHHRAYAQSLRPGILVYANTHEQPYMNDYLNAIFSEDGVEPGLRGGELWSNIGLFKYFYAEGDGRKPIRIECGRRIHVDRMNGPMPPRNQMLAVYEGAACQGAQQTFFEMGWTTKLARGDQDARDSLAALTAANRWLEANEGLFADAEPMAKTAVVMPVWESITPLVRAGRNFVVLQPKHLTPAQLEQFDLVVLANVRFMNDEQVRAVMGHVEKGGNLIATGETSFYDGLLRARAAPGLAALWDKPAGGAKRMENRYGKGTVIRYPRAVGPADVLGDWARLEGIPLASIQAESTAVCFNLARSRDGRRTLLYLLNYGNEPVPTVKVTLNLPSAAGALRLHAPGRKPAELTGSAGPDGLVVSVPNLDLLGVLEAE